MTKDTEVRAIRYTCSDPLVASFLSQLGDYVATAENEAAAKMGRLMFGLVISIIDKDVSRADLLALIVEDLPSTVASHIIKILEDGMAEQILEFEAPGKELH